jgi:aminocarboxymuconate-semialdehyde decarboxylase
METEIITCGSGSPASSESTARGRSDGGPVIDIHCHLGVPAASRHVPEQFHFAPSATPTLSDLVNGAMMRAVAHQLNGIDVRLQDMDRLGIDVQVMSPNPGQYFYAAPVECTRACAREINDALAEAVSKEPTRLLGLGTVPMQDVAEAVAEMRRCSHDLGFRGIEIGTNVAGLDYDDPSFAPFFQAAEELDMLLFMHPMGFTEPKRLTKYHLANVIGNPLDTTVAVSHLVFGGVLDRHPGLKICLAHGGGFIGAYAGRWEHAFHHRDDCKTCISRPPSDYLKQLYFDTLVFDKKQLDALLDKWGPERLCLGSDYPFDMAEPDPVGFHDSLNDTARNAILGGNAQMLLGLSGELSITRAGKD